MITESTICEITKSFTKKTKIEFRAPVAPPDGQFINQTIESASTASLKLHRKHMLDALVISKVLCWRVYLENETEI